MLRTKVMFAAYLVFTALCSFFEITNSRASTLWKLNVETGKIENMQQHTAHQNTLEAGIPIHFDATADIYSKDEMFYIIVASTRKDDTNGWLRESPETSFDSLIAARNSRSADANNYEAIKYETSGAKNNSVTVHVPNTALIVGETLDCGQPANYTHYDYIINVGAHFKHKHTPQMPEPEVAYFFLRSHDEEAYKNFNVGALERRLKKAKRETMPLSAELYHQIGNYWRIIGDAVQAVKCFRRALDISPTESEIMFNLARVLYNLQYLDDAIHMTRRSIEFQSPPHTAWRQYFMLGEILKTYGDFRESIHYYRLALDLNPAHELIVKALHDVENRSSATLHVYTVVIIIALVVAVLIVIVTSSALDGGRCGFKTTNGYTATYDHEMKARHFNRAMAMRSLKGLSNARNIRHRKY